MAGVRVELKAAEKKLRSRLRRMASLVLAACIAPRDRPRVHIDPVAIREILVVRLNSRMGNALFLTPFLTALHDVVPLAAIDIFITYPDAADLLRGLPGVRNVIVMPHKSWWRLGPLKRTWRAYRANRYDLAIDPQRNSAGARLALLCARARWRLGFRGPEQWAPLDFAADLPADVLHEALRPLVLLHQAFAHEVLEPRLCVANSTEELDAGRELLKASLQKAGSGATRGGATVIGFFAGARGKKDLGAEWWGGFWQAYVALYPETIPFEVLPAAAHPPVVATFATVYCQSPRMLAATIAHADWFVSADTGPMHVASAAGVPTIALFNHSNPAKYGPLKRADKVVLVAGMTPQGAAAACAELISAAALEQTRAPQQGTAATGMALTGG